MPYVVQDFFFIDFHIDVLPDVPDTLVKSAKCVSRSVVHTFIRGYCATQIDEILH